jgi:hypothetical protein
MDARIRGESVRPPPSSGSEVTGRWVQYVARGLGVTVSFAVYINRGNNEWSRTPTQVSQRVVGRIPLLSAAPPSFPPRSVQRGIPPLLQGAQRMRGGRSSRTGPVSSSGGGSVHVCSCCGRRVVGRIAACGSCRSAHQSGQVAELPLQFYLA